MSLKSSGRSNKNMWIVVIAALVVGVAGFFVGKFAISDKDGNGESLPCNVILISLDTLGAQHMGCYGYHRDTSPNLDKFAKNAVVFDRAFAQSPNTIVSHATMFTALQPEVHETSGKYMLSDDYNTLAEYLKKAGYLTAGYTTHGTWLCYDMGMGQGFDILDAKFRNAVENNKLAIKFLEEHKSDRFFLFVHYYDIHSDYEKLPYWTGTEYDTKFCPDYKGKFTGCVGDECASKLLDRVNRKKDSVSLSKEDIEYIKALYDGGISYTDYHVNVFLNRLKELGLYENSLIIITSDHGEEFMQHGRVMHTQLYSELMHVPLFIKFPGAEGSTKGKKHKRIKTPVGLIDIMPTILDYVGVKYKNIQGKSLMPVINSGKPGSRRVFSSYYGSQVHAKTGIIALRNHKYSFFTPNKNFGMKMFDLEKDFGEQDNIAETAQAERKKLFKIAREYYEAQKKIRSVFKSRRQKANYSEKDMEKLRQLGYLN